MRMGIGIGKNEFNVSNVIAILIQSENEKEQSEIDFRVWQLDTHRKEIADLLTKIFYGDCKNDK